MSDFWRNERVLVTGGRGFLGSHLVAALQQAGACVYAPNSAAYDLRVQDEVIAMFVDAGPTSVLFHLAATVGGIGANQKYPADFYFDNTMMNTLVAEFARRFKVGKFVGVGSVCAYPKMQYVMHEENLWAGYPEPTNAAYGIAKRGLLAHLQALRQEYGFDAIYLVPTNLYGPGDDFDPETSHVIPALIRKIDEAEDIVTVWGTGRASRDFLYVTDCVQALMLAAERYDSPEPLNVGSGQEMYIAGLVQMLMDIMECKAKVVWDTGKPDGQPRRVLDIGRIKAALGWQPATPLADGLRKTVEWWKNLQQ